MYKELNKYLDKNIYPFHMPGHKRNKEYLNFEKDILQYDLTELEDTDNLHEPIGIIKNLEDKCSKIFCSDKSFLMVNGSSGGIISAILTVCNNKDKILILRGCHKSVFNAIIYADAIPIYIYPKLNSQGLVVGLDEDELETILKKNKDIKAILVTSPTYEGFVLDIKKISKIANLYNKILIVDEAHGAHFKFHKSFPTSALELGADITIQSLHKTLPCFTQTSVLHVRGNKIDIDILKKNLTMIQTSSPSYIFMVGVDRCLSIIEKDKNIFDNYVSMLKNFRKNCNYKNINLISSNNLDIGKLLFYIKKDISAHEIYKMLEKDYKLQLEFSTDTYILAMTSIADTKYGFDLLHKSLSDIDMRINYLKERMGKHKYNYHTTKVAITPKEAFNKKGTLVPIQRSLGKISLDFITPYPPGVPIVVPGEIITQEILDDIINLNIKKDINII